jgi:hypothetical protein
MGAARPSSANVVKEDDLSFEEKDERRDRP